MKKKNRAWRPLIFAWMLLLLLTFVTADSLLHFMTPDTETVVVPDLVGRRIEELSSEPSLRIETSYRYDEQTPEGQVISQEPAAGVKRKRPSDGGPLSVTVYVSLGRETVSIPHVVGMDAEAAKTLLQRVGLRVRVEERESGKPRGVVLSVSPKEGAQLPRGTEVLLSVSIGRRVVERALPQLYGLPQSEALLHLWRMRLSAVEVIKEPSVLPKGRVTRQEPPPGTQVTEELEVRLYVSSGLSEEEEHRSNDE